MKLHFSAGWLLSVCVCGRPFGGGGLLNALCKRRLMNPHMRAPESSWDTLGLHFRAVCIIQHRFLNVFSYLSNCRFFFFLFSSWKLLKNPSGVSINTSLICAAATPQLESQNTRLNHNNPSRKLPPRIPPPTSPSPGRLLMLCSL